MATKTNKNSGKSKTRKGRALTQSPRANKNTERTLKYHPKSTESSRNQWRKAVKSAISKSEAA